MNHAEILTAISSLENSTKTPDWSFNFSEEEKRFFSHLINTKPPIGTPIQPDNASWWIKKFGIEKVKVALSVYGKQVNKARKNPEIPMPQSIGAYMRKMLNENKSNNQSRSLTII